MDQEGPRREQSGGLALAEKKIDRFYWIAALILTVGVRLYLFKNYYTINNDGVVYIEAARHFWEGEWGEGLGSFYPPIFPLMIAGLYRFLGDWELAGQLCSLSLGILILFPLFGLLRRIYGLRVAQVALFFYGVSPYLARLALEVRTEIPYTFFLVLALYFLQRGLDGENWLSFLLMGMSSALAYLIRPEAIGLMVVGCFFLLYRGWMMGQLRKYGLRAGVLALGFVIFSAPYVTYLRWDTGKWAISRKTGLVFSMALARHGMDWDEPGATDSNQVQVVNFIASHPLAYAKKVFMDAFRSLGFYLEALHYAYLPFLLVGWLLFFRGRFWEKSDFLFLVLVTFYLGAFALLYVTRRYGVPLVPISLGWIASGYYFLGESLGNSLGRRYGRCCMGILLLLFLVGTLPKTLQAIGQDKFYLREAGAYLKAKPGSPTIVTTNARVAFYAEGDNRVRLVDAKELPGLLEKEAGFLALEESGSRNLARLLGEHGWLSQKEFSNDRQETLLIFHRAEGR